MLALGAILVLVGCGGSGSTNGQGEASGVVFGSDGTVVRDAHVFYDGGHETSSNVAGVYVISGLPTKDVVIKAEVTKDGVTYRGQNVALVNSGERTKDVNIAVFAPGQLATLRGTVRDRQGRLLSGMRVFARPVDDSFPATATARTNNDGDFEIGGLGANINYRVQVNGLGYDSDLDTFSLSPGESRYVEFTAPDPAGNGVARPQNLAASVYTSPRSTRGIAKQELAMEAIKQLLSPKRAAKPATRLTTNGNRIEVDLFWDRPSTTDDITELLGYGIYRAIGNGDFSNTDFLRDPQANYFADLDDSLIEQRNYTYGITALDTLFDGSEGETGLSNTVTVRALGDLILGNVNATSQPTFNWTAAPGASSYLVYIFDEFPSIKVTERFVSNAVTGTSFHYTGTPLGNGRTFYYVVVAEDGSSPENSSAFSISSVGQFVVH